MVNQGFKVNNSPEPEYKRPNNQSNDIEIEDLDADDDSRSTGNLTLTLSHPKTDVKSLKNAEKNYQSLVNDTPQKIDRNKLENRSTQTNITTTNVKHSQTETNFNIEQLKSQIQKYLIEIKEKNGIIKQISLISEQYKQSCQKLNREKEKTNECIDGLKVLNKDKEESLKKLETINNLLKTEVSAFKIKEQTEIHKLSDTIHEENQTLLGELQRIEREKNEMIIEYKQLLSKERSEYSTSLKELQIKLNNMQTKLDERETEVINSSDDVKETTNKYTSKICELEDKCFKLRSELDSCKVELNSVQSEMERWKNLATERLIKMEQIGAQIKERHKQEMESYKAESQHWISQLNETQREHMELRTRLTEQKTLHLKQLAEKDEHIDQMRSVINNLKSQILNMQTMLTINDPSFDLSAIVEVEEVSEQQSDRLELKCESSVDLNDSQDDLLKMPCTSTAIWQEPVIERLRREKLLMSKQNAVLRRQIKAVAARERRSHLDAQNLKNQIFRISTSGNKLPSAESSALQSKVANLQAQLAGARREASSSLALWDKCKRAQQAAERWQTRYEEKCQEVNKLESSLALTRSAVTRLEKEKRILLSKLSEDEQREERHSAIEKQDAEVLEKEGGREVVEGGGAAAVSTHALCARIEAQQRRIVALELAQRGNEPLVSEYEKSLAEITALKSQILKLESTLLEVQIKSPLKATGTTPELEYWKNYCDMLKEENTQLTVRVSALESAAAEPPQRVDQLQRTVLTLRGLVSKLQAEQKSSNSNRRVESRPSSAKNKTDKTKINENSYRIEISNLKKSIIEKDVLLQKSKEMLNMAMEKNDRLSMENMFLRQRLDELTE